jgi:hypothetical protein
VAEGPIDRCRRAADRAMARGPLGGRKAVVARAGGHPKLFTEAVISNHEISLQGMLPACGAIMTKCGANMWAEIVMFLLKYGEQQLEFSCRQGLASIQRVPWLPIRKPFRRGCVQIFASLPASPVFP